MQATLEQRVESLEQQIAVMREAELARVAGPAVKKDWRSTFGWARKATQYTSAMELGEQYRREQTYEQELNAEHARP